MNNLQVNCPQVNFKCTFDVVGCNVILGTNVVPLAWVPIKMCASMKKILRCVIMNQKPLQVHILEQHNYKTT